MGDMDDFQPTNKRLRQHAANSDYFQPPTKRHEAEMGLKKFQCPEDGCKSSYTTKFNLQRHLKDQHGKNSSDSSSTTAGRFICHVQSCAKAFFHASKLIDHYKEHKLADCTTSKEFLSWEAFLSWKQAEEEASHTCFIQPKGESTCTSQNPELRSLLYTCCRDGKPRENKCPRKTDEKRKIMKKSRKLEGSYCLARMHVKHHISSGNVVVTYISTHTNHSLGLEECKYIPLPQSVRKEIQQKFAQGITLERIMDDIRADLGQRHQRGKFDERATRKHFITHQDCRNACRKVRDFTNHLHQNDAISVDRIIKELQCEDPSPVVAYKPRGVTDDSYPCLMKDNFFLVLMTDFQRSLFQKFSSLICVDSTHKTNEYGYKLMTIVVADEFRNGQPVAWTIADVEDTNTYEEMFKAVKATAPDASINTVMTDDDSTIIAACTQVYPGVIHLLCRWHVDRAWQKKLHSFVRDDGHKAEIYKYLWMLISEQDVEIFQENIKAFITHWSEKQPKFVSYFKEYYANRVEKWAFCYRNFEHKDVDTNMLVESFHNKLKTNPRYLNHNVNRRCDDLISVLLSVEVDMFYDRKRKEVLSSTTEASVKVEGGRHARGLSIMDLKVHAQEGQNQFLVDSSDSKSQYRVNILSSTCSEQPTCLPHCVENECSYLCRHMISCSCYDFQHGHLCKHSHKVHSLLKSPEPDEPDDPCPLSNDPDDRVSTKEIGTQPLTVSQGAIALKGNREAIKAHIMEINESVDMVFGGSTLDHVLAKLLPILTTVRAHLDQQQKQPSAVPEKFDVSVRFAPTQKNETQLRFDKVKAKGSRAKFPLKHPSKEEQSVIQQVLKQESEMPEMDKESTQDEPSHKGYSTGYKRKRCGTCAGCTGDDCGTCNFCRDKPKFGGPGRKKKCCTKRRCLNLTNDENARQSIFTHQPEILTALGFADPVSHSTKCPNTYQPPVTSRVKEAALPLADVKNRLSRAVDSFRHSVDRSKVNPANCFVVPSSKFDVASQQFHLSRAIWQMKVAIALEVPTEAKLCRNPHVTHTASKYIAAQVLPLLQSQRRTVDAMLPDGNCLFRALSKALFGVQSGHIKLRSLLVSFIESNTRVLGGLCNGTVESHCSMMRKASTFGTQAELQAAASLFQVMIYVFDSASEERGWRWMRYKPYSKDKLLFQPTCEFPTRSLSH